MPELSRFFGIIVHIYYLDHNPPHIHVTVGGTARESSNARYKALVQISNGRILKGSLPSKANKLLQAWLILHHDELLDAWREASAGRNPGEIEPLR